jgi:hypothetical protein
MAGGVFLNQRWPLRDDTRRLLEAAQPRHPTDPRVRALIERVRAERTNRAAVENT